MSIRVSVNWIDTNVVEEGYRVYKSTEMFDENSLPEPIVLEKGSTEWVDTDVEYGKTYYYAISAFNSQDESISEVRSITMIEKTYTYAKEENMIRILDTKTGGEITNILNVFSDPSRVDDNGQNHKMVVVNDGTIFIHNENEVVCYDNTNEEKFRVNTQNMARPINDMFVAPDKKFFILGSRSNSQRTKNIYYFDSNGDVLSNINSLFGSSTTFLSDDNRSRILNLDTENQSVLWLHSTDTSSRGIFSRIDIKDENELEHLSNNGINGNQSTYTLPVLMDRDDFFAAFSFQSTPSNSSGTIRSWKKSPFDRYDIEYTEDLPFTPTDWDFNKRNRKIYGISRDAKIFSINYLSGKVQDLYEIPGATAAYKLSINNFNDIIVATDIGTLCLNEELDAIKWSFNGQLGTSTSVASQGGQYLHRNSIKVIQKGDV